MSTQSPRIWTRPLGISGESPEWTRRDPFSHLHAQRLACCPDSMETLLVRATLGEGATAAYLWRDGTSTRLAPFKYGAQLPGASATDPVVTWETADDFTFLSTRAIAPTVLIPALAKVLHRAVELAPRLGPVDRSALHAALRDVRCWACGKVDRGAIESMGEETLARVHAPLDRSKTEDETRDALFRATRSILRLAHSPELFGPEWNIEKAGSACHAVFADLALDARAAQALWRSVTRTFRRAVGDRIFVGLADAASEPQPWPTSRYGS